MRQELYTVLGRNCFFLGSNKWMFDGYDVMYMLAKKPFHYRWVLKQERYWVQVVVVL